MAKYKIVHYLNQFFAGIGGEDKADFAPEVREDVLGPGLALKAGLGEDYEILTLQQIQLSIWLRNTTQMYL